MSKGKIAAWSALAGAILNGLIEIPGLPLF